MDVYHTNHLWALSRHMINSMEKLDLDVVLGLRNNADELRGLLRTIRAINFDECPGQCALWGTTEGLSPDGQGDGHT